MKNDKFTQRFKNAWNGIVSTWQLEKSFRFQILSASCAYLLLFFLRAEPLWWALFTLSVGGVLACELINTTIERLADHLHPTLHPQIKLVKDSAAGAVLVLSFAAALVLICFLFEQFGP